MLTDIISTDCFGVPFENYSEAFSRILWMLQNQPYMTKFYYGNSYIFGTNKGSLAKKAQWIGYIFSSFELVLFMLFMSVSSKNMRAVGKSHWGKTWITQITRKLLKLQTKLAHTHHVGFFSWNFARLKLYEIPPPFSIN